MAEIVSRTINAGDPVTADIINNLILDLNKLNEATPSSFNLNLAATGASTGATTSVSQKVYSTTVSKVSVNPLSTPSGKGSWTFPSKAFTKAPRCWIQLNSGGAKLTEAQSRIHIVITSIDATKMTFEIRSGAGNEKATLNFDCFAVEAL